MSNRKGWVYLADGRVLEKGSPEHYEYIAGQNGNSTMFAGDLQDFVSPIDGKLYSGRAGLREHNRRHNVVPNAELKGLPTLTTHQEYKPDRAAIRGELINAARAKGLI